MGMGVGVGVGLDASVGAVKPFVLRVGMALPEEIMSEDVDDL